MLLEEKNEEVPKTGEESILAWGGESRLKSGVLFVNGGEGTCKGDIG